MREYGGNGIVAPCIFNVEISRKTILDALEKKNRLPFLAIEPRRSTSSLVTKLVELFGILKLSLCLNVG